jgi:hypothetical protein
MLFGNISEPPADEGRYSHGCGSLKVNRTTLECLFINTSGPAGFWKIWEEVRTLADNLGHTEAIHQLSAPGTIER